MTQVPLAPPPPGKDSTQDRWLWLLWRRLTQAGQLLWSSLNFSGSNLTDIETRNHADLQNLNTASYTHLSATNATDLTDGGATTLHKHDHGLLDGLTDDDHPQYVLVTNLEVDRATIVTNWDDLTDGGATTLHKHSHNAQDDLQGGSTGDYFHFTSAEKTGVIGAQYLTLATSTTLTNERTLAVGTGLSTVDSGAGAAFTVSLVPFVGDSGSGGSIGAVPAPAAGDGAVRKYLSAEGIWRDPGTSGDIAHNNTTDIQGGLSTGVFQSGVFQSGVFQSGTIEYYHVSASNFNELSRLDAVTTVSVDTVMTDDYATYIVDTSAQTMTLPEAVPSRIGRSWTVIMNCNGYVDVEPDPTDEIILPGGTDTIRLDEIGSNVTLKCVTSTQWVIV